METVIEIEGVNGEWFTIAGDRAGDKGVYMVPEVSGLLDPEVRVVSDSPANFPGGRYVSHRIQPRHMMFAVDIVSDGAGSASGVSRESEWRKAWAYDRPSKIHVTTRDGTRTLEAYLEMAEVGTKYDPHVEEVLRVIMNVVGYDPFWWGEEEIFELTLGSGTGTITVPNANPTDQLVWPVWAVEAPGAWSLPDYSFGSALADRQVMLPSLTAGEHVVVDTNPRTRQLTSINDTPVWQRMEGRRFRHPIPPWTEEVTFSITRAGGGTGKVQLRLRRPFSRPWGML